MWYPVLISSIALSVIYWEYLFYKYYSYKSEIPCKYLSSSDIEILSQKLYPVPFLEYLAKSTTWIQFFLITYILFVTKMQKRQTLWNGFALFKNDITDFLPAPEIKIHSRTHKVSSGCDMVWISGKIQPFDICWSLQVSQNFRASDKNSF